MFTLYTLKVQTLLDTVIFPTYNHVNVTFINFLAPRRRPRASLYGMLYGRAHATRCVE